VKVIITGGGTTDQRQGIPVVGRWSSFSNDYVTAATYWLTVSCVIIIIIIIKIDGWM